MQLRRLCTLFATAVIVSVGSVCCAQAQEGVQIEGASFKVAHQRVSREYELTGSVNALTNYTYQDVSGVVLKVGLSKKRLTERGDISGYTLASASVGTLLARTRIKHIPVYGWGVIPKGNFYPIIVAVDGSGHIVAAAMHKKRFEATVKGGIASIRRLSLAPASTRPVTFEEEAEFVG